MSTATAAPPAAAARNSGTSRRLVDRVLRLREASLLGVLAVLVVVTETGNPRFLGAQGVKDLLLDATILVLVAIGEAVVVITRNVDLSVGSVVGIAAFAVGDYVGHGGNTVVGVLIGVAVGAVFGVVNGLLVSLGRVPALVVTLGTLYIIRGLDSMWVGAREITASNLPAGFVRFGHQGLGPMPFLAILALVVLVAVAWYLRGYPSGRECYALGSNPEAARLAGIPVRRRIIAAYVLCGALAGLAGALYLARFGNVDSGTAGGFELTVVSAVVVGGVAFTGGAGSVYGAALGALLLTSINSALPALGVSSVGEQAIDGFLLLLAITVDRLVARRVARALRRRNARHG
jgi:rhamnose transport system permease protein